MPGHSLHQCVDNQIGGLATVNKVFQTMHVSYTPLYIELQIKTCHEVSAGLVLGLSASNRFSHAPIPKAFIDICRREIWHVKWHSLLLIEILCNTLQTGQQMYVYSCLYSRPRVNVSIHDIVYVMQVGCIAPCTEICYGCHAPSL